MINGDNPVERRLHDGALARLAFTERVPSLFALGDVVGDAHDAVDLSLLVFNGESPVMNPPLGTIRADDTVNFINLTRRRRIQDSLDALAVHRTAGGATLTGTIYLGADHPTNPFRHKWDPIERHGYAITRYLTINFDSEAPTNATAEPGFGVNYVTGYYRENIFGLHKPLGPNQDIGLITDGTIRLEHVFKP